MYFGYPQAHEDDAQRAGRAGLGILEALGPLNARLEQDRGLRLAVRVGVHTGPVVVGVMGGGGRQEHVALGDTPNIAARLQGLAGPNTVVISAATRGCLWGFLPARRWASTSSKGWMSLCGSTSFWRRAERRRASTWYPAWADAPGRAGERGGAASGALDGE